MTIFTDLFRGDQAEQALKTISAGLPWLLLGAASLKDLLNGRVSVRLLILFDLSCLVCAAETWLEGSRMILVLQCLETAVLTGGSAVFVLKKELGAADLFVLGGLPFLMGPDLLTGAVLAAFIHAGLCSVIVAAFRLPQKTIPLLPFLFLGCLWAGTGIWNF